MTAVAPPSAPQPVFATRESPPSSPGPIRPYDSPQASPTQVTGSNRNSVNSIRRKSVPSAPQSPISPTTNTAMHHGRQQSLDGIHEDTAYGEQPRWPARRDSVVPNKVPTPEDYDQQLPQFDSRVTSMQSTASEDLRSPSLDLKLNLPSRDDPRIQEALTSPGFHPQHVIHPTPIPEPQAAIISSGESNRSSAGSYMGTGPGTPRTETPASSGEIMQTQEPKPTKLYSQLQYHHQQFVQTPDSSSLSVDNPNGAPYSRNSSSPASSDGHAVHMRHLDPLAAQRRGSRPMSSYSTLSVDNLRRASPASPGGRRAASSTYDQRRASFLDLTAPAHVQHAPVASNLGNSYLQAAVGENLSLLSSKKTLDMYRANAKKTGDPMLQYELAVFMIQIAQQQPEGDNSGRPSHSSDGKNSPLGFEDGPSRKELLREARQLLERLQSRLPQAQYYLADAYASGLWNKGKEENDKAFPLFVAASKHGHAEAGYRAALCYEFGWGCKRDPMKAVQFYRAAAAKNHPGAMTRLGMACLRSDLGLSGKYREGVKWLKRATDIADEQYPSAPYELGLLHETGFGEDVFQDPSYAAQLFTQAADLGHVEAYFRMGEAYEHGMLNCPRDAALSVHYYTGAAQRGHPGAMMALCAWYLVGAEPVLEKNEEEAYIWACKASEMGLPKAEYARGYFTETGIGCRKDPLEANVWYVRAADHGDERAVARLKLINQAASGGYGNAPKDKADKKKAQSKSRPVSQGAAKVLTKEKGEKDGEGKEKGDCCIM